MSEPNFSIREQNEIANTVAEQVSDSDIVEFGAVSVSESGLVVLPIDYVYTEYTRQEISEQLHDTIRTLSKMRMTVSKQTVEFADVGLKNGAKIRGNLVG